MHLNCNLHDEALTVIIYVTKKTIMSMRMSLELSQILPQYVYPRKPSSPAFNLQSLDYHWKLPFPAHHSSQNPKEDSKKKQTPIALSS